MRPSVPGFALVLLGLALAAGAQPPASGAATVPGARGPSFLIVNPSGRGNQGLAEGFLGDFAAALQASWPKDAPQAAFSGRYHVHAADAVASIRRAPPVFAVVSPGFYLAHRDDMKLVPLLQPLRDHDGPAVVHLIVKTGSARRDPATMRLGGQLTGEPAWVAGPVLRLPAGAHPTFMPSARTLEAVRDLAAGTTDGVLLPDSDWALLQRSGKAAGLEIAFTSAELPEGPVVSFGEPSATTRAAAQAMLAFPGSEAGRKVLARMTLRGFREASASDYASLHASHDKALLELSR